MNKIDKALFDTDKVICRHLDETDKLSRNVISQDILAQLRHFTEHVMLKFYEVHLKQEIADSWKTIPEAIKYVKSQAKLKVLTRFHGLLQKTVSHYTPDEEAAERLMLKYYEYLFKIRELVKNEFQLDVLQNLEKFPLHQDPALQEYYVKIAEKINRHYPYGASEWERYYIRKVKPFFVNHKIYYEVTLSPATDYASKFDRMIVFTNQEIISNYAVKISLIDEYIDVLGKKIPVKIIADWKVSIRACEFRNFAKLVMGKAINISYGERERVSDFITITGYTLNEVVEFSDADFLAFKFNKFPVSEKSLIGDIFEKCRKIIKANKPGSNLLRYLLFHMNNVVSNCAKIN